MELPPRDLAAPGKRIIHVFGITQISAMHIDVLRWLGKHYDLRLYYLNPFVNRMPAAATKGEACEIMRRLANHLCERRGDAPVADELLCAWGKAGAESLWSMADMLDGPLRFAVERLPLAPAERSATVLSSLQRHLLGSLAKSENELPQDRSVQIVACPGMFREVETVYQSILHNLKQDPSLKQTDIAVMVTDMARYRPVLQSVFDRRPELLRYNLA